MNEFKWLMENVPVAGALIIVTRMWLTHLKTSEAATRELFASIAKDSKEVITSNTEALANVKQVMEKHLP